MCCWNGWARAAWARSSRPRNWKLDRLVALKVIRKDRLGDAEAVRRFQREVRAAAQLNHPNVVHAYDCGQSHDRHFYVMEYVEGIDLAQLVQAARVPCRSSRRAIAFARRRWVYNTLTNAAWYTATSSRTICC